MKIHLLSINKSQEMRISGGKPASVDKLSLTDQEKKKKIRKTTKQHSFRTVPKMFIYG
jgi:hypothetical protein